MKKRAEAYPFYNNDEDVGQAVRLLTEPAFDALLTTDRLEVDDLRYRLEQCLTDGLDVRRGLEEIPGVSWIVYSLESKLKKAGFDKNQIADSRKLYDLIAVMKNEQWGKYKGRTLRGFPKNTFSISDDKKQMWILEDIEAALFALWSFHRLKAIFDMQDSCNQPAAVCSLTFQFILDAARAGLLRKHALTGKRQSLKKRDIRGRRQTWKGLLPDDRAERNDKIRAAFSKWKKSANSFYENKAAKYGLKPSTIRKIVES